MLSLSLLGPFSLRAAGSEVKLSRKAQALLAFLGAGFPEPVARDRLAYLLWPDQTDGLARHGLRNSLFEIRRALGASASLLLGSNNAQVWLLPGNIEIDLVRFAAAAKTETAAELAAGLGLHRGEFAAGLNAGAEPFDEWADDKRRAFSESVQEGYRRLASMSLKAGDPRTAVEAGRRLVELDQLSETNHRVLIDALARGGLRTEALRQFRRCVEILDAELGIEPEPETAALAKRIEQAPEPAAPAPSPPRAAAASAQGGRAGPAGAGSGPVEEVFGRSWFKADNLSVGIVPLRNLSGGRIGEHLVEALTHDLVIDLAEVCRGFSIAQTPFADSAAIALSAARGDFTYLVAGAVQWAVNIVRLSIALIHVPSGGYLWTGRFECGEAELAATQTELTNRIARELHLRVLHDASRTLLRDPVEERVEELVAEGLGLLTSGGPGPGPVREAQAFFLKALAQDRRNPEALSGLGHCCFRLVSHPYWLPSAELLPSMIDLGREAVRNALAASSEDAYAHCVDGMLSSVAGDLEHAGTALSRATSLDPESAVAHAFAGFNAAFLGKAEETAPAAKRALALRPDDPARGAWLFLAGAGELLLGRAEQARPLLEASATADAQLGTPRLWLAAANALEGNDRGARSTLNDFETRYPSYRIRDFQTQFVQRSQHPSYRQQIERVLQPLRELGIPD